MRIKYLAAIAIAALVAGAGLAVHSVGSLPPEKQSTPAATQLASLLADSWIRFCIEVQIANDPARNLWPLTQ